MTFLMDLLSDLFVSFTQIFTQSYLTITNSPSGNLFLALDSGCFETSCLAISGSKFINSSKGPIWMLSMRTILS